MKQYTQEHIEEMLCDIGAAFPEEQQLKRALFAVKEHAPLRPYRRLGARKIVLLAALIVAASITTVFASDIANALKQFVFAGSSAAQYTLVDGDENIAISLDIVGRAAQAKPSEAQVFVKNDNLEGAQASAAFEIKLPQKLPNNALLDYIAVSSPGGYDVHAVYMITQPNAITSLALFEYYAGPGATLKLDTVYPIAPVMVGEIEASFVEASGGSQHLYWMQSDVLYELIGQNLGEKMMLAIAASLG